MMESDDIPEKYIIKMFSTFFMSDTCPVQLTLLIRFEIIL